VGGTGRVRTAAGCLPRGSVRPSERGDWIVAIYGSAPVEARVAVIAYENVERRLSVEAGFYAFMTRVATEPEPTMTRPWFE
jgi:hypothetical protein